MRIPVSKPWLTALECEYAAQAVASGWISSTGPFIERVESAIAEHSGATHALTTCNGTAALHLAMLALDVQPGDEVIVPSMTFVAVANAVKYVGGVPVFVDVDRDSWCVNLEDVARKVTLRTRGIIAVHSYGRSPNMVKLCALAQEQQLWIVEDLAEAHFVPFRAGRVGVYSFYGNKELTSGEGGAFVTNDAELAARARLIRGQGMDPKRRYFFPIIGNNFRMTNVAAAILCAQLERHEQIYGERMRVVRRYAEALGSMWRKGASPWLYSMTMSNRDALAQKLAAAGVETRPLFYPLHQLPPYTTGQTLQVTEELSAAGISLPTYPELTDGEIDEICALAA